MAASMIDIAWLAGLLEGEGCFVATHHGRAYPAIQLIMTDADPVARAAALLDARCIKTAHVTKAGKATYRTNVYGQHAISWMMTLYRLMGLRRREKIRECLTAWRNAPTRPSARRYARAHPGQVPA